MWRKNKKTSLNGTKTQESGRDRRWLKTEDLNRTIFAITYYSKLILRVKTPLKLVFHGHSLNVNISLFVLIIFVVALQNFTYYDSQYTALLSQPNNFLLTFNPKINKSTRWNQISIIYIMDNGTTVIKSPLF